jgi:hypothetical protein
MTGGGCWVASLVGEASLSHIPDFSGHNSDRPGPAEGPWAYSAACSCQRAYEGLAACQGGYLEGEGAAGEAPRANRPGRDHPRHSRYRPTVPER